VEEDEADRVREADELVKGAERAVKEKRDAALHAASAAEAAAQVGVSIGVVKTQ
jgi:hypothetical protein